MMTQKEYLEANGMKCPNCGSDNLLSDDPEPVDRNLTAVSGVECLDCGSTWTDIFHLVAYEDLEIPK